MLVHLCRHNDLVAHPSRNVDAVGYESRNVATQARSISRSYSISITAWSTCIMPGHSYNAELAPHSQDGSIDGY
jgi:hypothetical protein